MPGVRGEKRREGKVRGERRRGKEKVRGKRGEEKRTLLVKGKYICFSGEYIANAVKTCCSGGSTVVSFPDCIDWNWDQTRLIVPFTHRFHCT